MDFVFRRVDVLFELFADFEKRNPLGGNLYDLTGLGVAALIAPIASIDERPEASNLNSIILAERFGHRVENEVHDKLGLLVLKVGAFGDEMDQIRLGHGPIFRASAQEIKELGGVLGG